MTDMLSEFADECADRTTNVRGWIRARNWIERCLGYEDTLRKLAEMKSTLPPGARRLIEDAVPFPMSTDRNVRA